MQMAALWNVSGFLLYLFLLRELKLLRLLELRLELLRLREEFLLTELGRGAQRLDCLQLLQRLKTSRHALLQSSGNIQR